MTYQQQYELSVDAGFLNRTWSALCEESTAKPNDELAGQILASPYSGVMAFMPYLATAPGFDDEFAAGGSAAIADGELLAAIQASWSHVKIPGGPA